MARLRPRFEFEIPCQPQQALSSFQLRLKQPECPFTGRIIQERHIILRMRPSERHYWSPILSVDAHDHANGTLLRGYFGPHPNVWSFFVALYSAIAFVTLLGLMYGLSQWMIQTPPLALLALPAGLGMAAGVNGIATLGQRFAQAQMLQLRDFFACTVCHPQLEEIRGQIGDTPETSACRVCAGATGGCALAPD